MATFQLFGLLLTAVRCTPLCDMNVQKQQLTTENRSFCVSLPFVNKNILIMSEIYDQVSKNVINNLQNINLALENSKIESKVLTPAFTEKLEKLKNINDETNDGQSISTSQLSFNCSENVKNYSRQEINNAFARIRALPKEFAPVKDKIGKKAIGKSISCIPAAIRANPALNRAESLQNFNETSRPSSRSNSLLDLATDTVPIKVEALLEKINENKEMLEGIKSSALKYPETTNFGGERFKLAKEFKRALAEITEMVNNLEQNVKAIDKEDVDFVLDEELNEMLEQFTKVTCRFYGFLKKTFKKSSF